VLGLFGTSFVYGGGIITPSISVLSAVEGLSIATPRFAPYIIPITVAILIGLFSLQQRGTSSVGSVFGPITLVWFITLAALGVWQLSQHPGVLVAIHPLHAARFFLSNGWNGFLVLGS